MGRPVILSWSTKILVIALCCLCIHSFAEGARDDSSQTSVPLALQADQATHGRPSQQRITINGAYETRSSRKETYGFRIEPLSELKKSDYDGNNDTVVTQLLPRTKTVRRVVRGRGSKTTTTEKPPTEKSDNGDSMVMADAGGKSSSAEDGGNDEKKTLAQQVADGKYGLIQELLPNSVERPGVISYASNPEVPKDTAENLGGLGQDDIWLAEDHVLVLAGGSFRDKGGGLEQPWPPIDGYVAPRRQVKIPAKPSVPPPFPIQLREGEPPRFIGDEGPSFPHHTQDTHNQAQGNYPTGSGPIQSGPWANNGSLPAKVPYNQPEGLEPVAPHPQAPLHSQAPGEQPPYPPPTYLPYPPPPVPPENGNFRPPLYPPVPFVPAENLTEPFDEDDPSLYYPPPYDFYYPSDNSTEIPPGPLVPGIVLPPPPDFFSPLNDTSIKRRPPTIEKEPPTHKKVQYKPKDGIRAGYRPSVPSKTRVTTSTPGPKYLPVTIKTRDGIASTTQKQRPIHIKQRPTLPPKGFTQEHPNQVTPIPQVEVIPLDIKSPQIVKEEQREDTDTVRQIPLEPNNLHNIQEKYPTRTNQQPLYYYDGPGISQIVVTPSPRPIYIQDFTQRNKEESLTTPSPPKSSKNQIIYIFTSPEQQDVVANQVSSTEYPQSLRDHQKYEYNYEDQRQAKTQGPDLGYKQDVPTPPRLENFHSYFDGSKLNGQFFDFIPSPIDHGSKRGFQFPDEGQNPETATVTPRPSNYYLDDINRDIQNFRQFGFGKNNDNPNPVIYYSIPASNVAENSNKTQTVMSSGISASTPKPAIQNSNQGQAFGGQIHPSQANDFNIRPVTYRPQFHYAYPDSFTGDERLTIVTPKPTSHYSNPISINSEHKNRAPSRGNDGISIITVKPSVVYSNTVSAKGFQSNPGETKTDSRVPVVIPRPTTYYSSSVANRGSMRYNPKEVSNPTVSIVTPKPHIQIIDTLTNDEGNHFQHSGLQTEAPNIEYYSARENDKTEKQNQENYQDIQTPYTRNPIYYSNSGAPSSIISNNGHRGRNSGVKLVSPSPQIYFANVGSSTPSPAKLIDGTQYFVDDHPRSIVTVTPAPYYHTTQRTPKYISIPNIRTQFLTNARKKVPTAQYEEYFEANRNPTHLSQIGNINNYGEADQNGGYIQNTTPPTVHESNRPSYKQQQTQFAAYNQGIQNIAQYTTTPPTHTTRKPTYPSQVRQQNNYNQAIRSDVYTQSTPQPPIQPNKYNSQASQIGQVNHYNSGAPQEIYVQTTPSPIQYQYPISQGQGFQVSTPAPNYASIFNFPSSTASPLPSYYTTQDVNLFDDVTKNYFTIFGQKIGGQEKTSDENEGHRLRPTTPLPPLAEEFDDVRVPGGSLVYPTSRPTTESPQDHTVVSLVDDIRVNFRNPLPPINPDSEFIIPVRRQPPAPQPTQSSSAAAGLRNAVRGEGAVVSYQLPGVDGKGIGGGSHYYFLTPRPVSSDGRQQSYQQSNGYYQQGQGPVFNNYWNGYRSS